jgi:type IV pilus assembly protein PilC
MPLFVYTARDLSGIDHKGTIETADSSGVARILSKRGLIVTSIKEKRDANLKLFEKYLNRVAFEDVVVATRQLATMIESGLVLSEAVDILVDQQTNKKFKTALEEISRDIKNGLDLTSAIKKHPDIFPPLYGNLIKSAEQAGNLDVVLVQMADNMEKEREFRSKVRGAMIYPIIILFMMTAVMAIMVFFVIPRLTSLYSQSSIDLPLPTKILIGISGFFLSYWWIMLIVMILIGIGLNRMLANPEGRYIFDSFLLKVPVVGRIIRGTVLTNFTRTFGQLSSAGVPILEALQTIKDITTNKVFKKALEDTYSGVERGLTFSAQLDVVGVFPKIISQMFKVGEETGKIDKVAFKLADYFESEVDNMLKNLTVLIEPIVLVLLGVGVGFIVLSVILPIYKLTTSFS